MAKKKMELTDKQRRFCMVYIENGGNAKKAYEEVYNTSKMKPNTIYRKAYAMTQHPRVAEEIERLRDEFKQRWRLRIDRVLEELAYIATIDPKDIFDENWNVKPVDQIPEHARRAIESVQVGDTVKVKVFDKNAALEKFMKYFGAYEKDNEQKVTQITVKVEE